MEGEEGTNKIASLLPRNLTDGVCLLSSIMIIALVALGLSKAMDAIGFVDGEIRKFLLGLVFASLGPLTAALRGIAKKKFPELRSPSHGIFPWYATGLSCAGLLLGWNQFVSFLGSAAIANAIAHLSLSPEAATGFVASSAFASSVSMVSFPLTALAALSIGFVIDRHVRSCVFCAAVLAGIAYPVLNMALNWLFDHSAAGGVSSASSANLVGFWAGAVSFALAIGLCVTLGAAVSKVRGSHLHFT